MRTALVPVSCVFDLAVTVVGCSLAMPAVPAVQLWSDKLEHFMEFYEVQLSYMDSFEVLWSSMEFSKVLLTSMEFYGVLGSYMESM